MIGEVLDRLMTYGTPAFLIVKDLLGKMAKNPEAQKETTEALLKLTKGGRTRSDELVFISSLVTLTGISLKNKQLFLQKHTELLHPDLTGKSADQIKEMKAKEKLAKGIIFLIATDTTATEIDPRKRFMFSREVWYGIFLGIDSFPDDNSKLQALEQRILHFGKNHQEKATLRETAGEMNRLLGTIDSGIASRIDCLTGKINQQWEEIDKQRIVRKNLPAKGNAIKKVWGWWNDC